MVCLQDDTTQEYVTLIGDRGTVKNDVGST